MSGRAVWAAVAALAVLAAAAVATLALVPPDARVVLVREMPEGVGTLLALGAAWWSRRAAADSRRLANGELDTKVTRAVTAALVVRGEEGR